MFFPSEEYEELESDSDSEEIAETKYILVSAMKEGTSDSTVNGKDSAMKIFSH